MPAKKWTAADDAAFVQLAKEGLRRGEIAERLGRTVAAVETRASILGVKMKYVTAPALGLDAAPRLRKYFEALDYGKRTGHVAYVLDVTTMPNPSPGAEWVEDKSFNAANEILARPALKVMFQAALQKGCAIDIER